MNQKQANPTHATDDAQKIAERCAAILWEEDTAAQGLGVEILKIAPGLAQLRMRVRPDMANGHGTCHGGYIFTIADCAFSYACNSENHRAVAAGADISFIAPANVGDQLTATASVQNQGGRSGIYDVRVENQEGRLIALFRGRSTRVKQRFF